jgi:GNAT superfamily N-acetyltransferase
VSVAPRSPYEFYPVDEGRLADLERLFGPSGAYSGCWCMFWRLPSAEFSANGNPGNRRAMRRLVGRGEVPGLLAYAGGEPVGWVSVAPREAYPRLERSRNLKRIDDEPVWSIVCFFVARGHRRRGLMRDLIDAAVAHVRRRGGRVVEAYPIDFEDYSGTKGFMGLVRVFRDAGFAEAARPGGQRVVMRRVLRA